MTEAHKMQIDPEKFAYSVINNFQSAAIDNQRISKDHLTLYLQAYLLITEFNELEDGKFSYFEDKDKSKLYTVLSQMSKDQ